MDIDKIKREFAYIDSVEEVTAFHVWGISENQNCLMAHLRTTGTENEAVLQSAKNICAKNDFRFSTIQVETSAILN